MELLEEVEEEIPRNEAEPKPGKRIYEVYGNPNPGGAATNLVGNDYFSEVDPRVVTKLFLCPLCFCKLAYRDDAENHFEYAKKFITAGMPIYIDKPIATSIDSLNALYELEKYTGQIFTCSALRYASELRVTNEDRQQLGQIKSIEAVTPKSWEKYAVHIIEPVLNIIDTNDSVLKSSAEPLEGGGVKVSLKYQSGVNVSFTASGPLVAGPISIRLIGALSSKDYIFESTFPAFKLAITDFLAGIESRTCRSPRAYNERVVSIIEMGLNK